MPLLNKTADTLPFTAHPVHNGGLPTTVYEVDSQQGTPFTLDRLLHEAILFCIDPSRDLWMAYESDREVQKVTGEPRGWFRYRLTLDAEKLGPLAAYAGTHFPLARLVTNALPGEVPVPVVGYRTTNYCREALRKRNGYSIQSSREDFVALCGRLARARNPSLPANWEAVAMNRFRLADMLYEETVAQRREIAGEDDPVTIAAAPSLEGPNYKEAAR